MANLSDLMNGIARMEGFWVNGSRSQRNNNPGNLRASSLATGKDSSGYAIFPDIDTGWRALQRQIELDTGRGLTLGKFIAKYAPSSENNTGNYLKNIMQWLGVGADTSLSQIVAGEIVSSVNPNLNPTKGQVKGKRIRK